MPVLIKTQEIRSVVDPLILKLREDLYGSGVTFNRYIARSSIPPEIPDEDGVGDIVDDLGYIKHVSIYRGNTFVVNAKEITFSGTGVSVTSSGNRAIVTISGGITSGSGLVWAGLTTGQVYRATSATTAEFGPLNLSNTNTTENLLPQSRGGTNLNATATGPGVLKKITAGGNFQVAPVAFDEVDYTGTTGAVNSVLHFDGSSVDFRDVDFSGIDTSITGIVQPDHGGTGVANDPGAFVTFPDTGGTIATLEWDNYFEADTRVAMTAGTNGHGIYWHDGTDDFASFQCIDTGSATSVFFSANRQFDGTNWQQLNSRVGGTVILSSTGFNYYNFAASSSQPVLAFRIEQSTGQMTSALSTDNTDSAAIHLVLNHATTGTAAAGFGSAILTQLEDGGGTLRAVINEVATWATATSASRKGRKVWNIFDTASREALRIEASGSAAMIGFLGAAAVVRQTITGSRGGNAALANLLTGLANLGLITDSTS